MRRRPSQPRTCAPAQLPERSASLDHHGDRQGRLCVGPSVVYGKAGGAWVGGTNNSFAAGGTPVGVSVNSSSVGWTAGAGVEWAFAGNWSARAEYDFMGLQNQSFAVPGVPATRFAGDTINVNNRTIQMITAGLNYKFSLW
jgi:outer membrane immunogenic protein